MSNVESERSESRIHPPSDILIDAALGALVCCVVAAAIWADVEADAREPDAYAYLFAVALGAPMLVRRRWPVGVLMATIVLLFAYYALGYPPVGVAVPTAAAFYTVAEAGRLRLAIGTAAVVTVWSIVPRIVEEDDLDVVFGYELAASIMLLAAVIAFGDAVRSRRAWHGEMRHRARQAAVEQEREAVRRVEQERLRIARELHDVLAHTVSVISIQADVATEAVHDDPDQAGEALHTIRSASRDALTELRATLGLLRRSGSGGPREPVAGVDELDRLVESAVGSGLDVDVRVEGEPVSLPVVVDAAAHRVVQESLTNVLKHAGASQAVVELRYEPEALAVSVVDDGHGASVNGVGFGIEGMRERVELLGGRLQADNTPHGGFRVEASIPLRADA